MSLIDCEINLILTWSSPYVITSSTGAEKIDTKFDTITDTKPYAPAVTLSIQDNAKLSQQLKSCFKRTINLNKYQTKGKIQAQNAYLDYLSDLSLQRVKKLFAFPLEDIFLQL